MKLSEFENLEKTIKDISDSLTKWERILRDKHYDKKGVGFNLDGRFSVFKISLSLDSWAGTYGNSSCYTEMNVGPDKVFESYFIKYLNRNVNRILATVLDDMISDFEKNKQVKIEELQKELDRYQSSSIQKIGAAS